MTEEQFLAQRVRDQERLLAAMRIGGRTPTGAIDRLTKGRERWLRLRDSIGTK